MAPAHSHATSVAVYPALFLYILFDLFISKDNCWLTYLADFLFDFPVYILVDFLKFLSHNLVATCLKFSKVESFFRRSNDKKNFHPS